MLAGLWHGWHAGILETDGRHPVQCAAMLPDLVDLFRRPTAALERIEARRRLSDGLLALGLSILLPALVAELAAVGPFRPPVNLGSLPALTAQGADIYARWTYEHRFSLPVYGVLLSLALWLVAAGLIHGIARTLGGHGDFPGFVKLVGFVALVGLLALPVALLDALAKLQGNARLELSIGQLAGVLSLGLFLWQNVLLVFAARQHYAISTERAVAAVVGPIGVVAVLLLALFVLALVLLVLSQQVPL